MARRRGFETAIGLILLAGAVVFALLLAGVDLGLIAR
jgi:hypothetical protein